MKSLILLFITSLFTLNTYAQNQHYIDSLTNELKVQKQDSSAANILYELSKAYWDNSPEKALQFANQCLELSNRIGYQKGIGNAYNSLGNINRYKGEFQLALQYNQKALEVFEKIGDKQGIGLSFLCIGNIYNFQGNLPGALKNYLASLKINEEINDKKGIALAYNNIGGTYASLGNQTEALKNHLAAMRFYEELHDRKGIAGSYNNIGDVYNAEGNDAEALNNYSAALKLNNEIGNKNWEAINLSNIGSIYSHQKNYPEALKYYFESVTISQEIGDLYSVADSYCGIGNILTQQKKYSEANQYLLKALALSKEVGSLESMKNSYSGLAKLFTAKGDYKHAFDYYKFEIAYRDSMFNEENTKKAVQQQMQYDFDKKESLAKLEQEKKDAVQQTELTKQRSQKYIFVSGVALLLLIAIGLISRLRFARKNRLQLEEKNKRIAEEKEIADQQRERAERSEKFKQQFLANMSHEIRTPMNAVMGMTNLLIEKKPRSDQFSYLDGIKKSSDNLLHIINDILDLSKIEVGKMELEKIDFSVRDMVGQVKQTLNYKAGEKGLDLITVIDSSIPDVLTGDPTRLNQVLMNLAGNAIKFTEKGSVTIEIEKSVIENNIRFSIMDTGIGIPKDKLQTVFESFSQANASDTRKHGGTGLGLSISKQLVELMGGKIAIESEEGTGTIFSFEINLPVGSKERMQEQKSSEQIDGSILNGLKILIVDDNEYNRIVVQDTLMLMATVEIIQATNGQEAIAAVNQNNVDVILMDVQMPLMNGYDATKYIREKLTAPKSLTPVIALTASVIRSDLDKCRAAGMNDYVPKPFTTAQLISAIANATGREIKFSVQRESHMKSDIGNHSPVTNLSFLEKFCRGDKTQMQKYITMFTATAPGLVEKLTLALSKNDFEEIANQVHSFKTKWMMMGMDASKDLAIMIEQQCRENAQYESVKENVVKLIELIQTAATELT